MAKSWIVAVLSLLSLLGPARAQNTGIFTNPGGINEQNTYSVGQSLNITWVDTDTYYVLSLGILSSTNPDIVWLLSNVANKPSSFEWTVQTYGLNLSENSVYTLTITNGTAFGSEFYSPTFFIEASSAESSSSSASTPTSTTTAAAGGPTNLSSTSPISTTSATSATSSASASPSVSTSTSPSASTSNAPASSAQSSSGLSSGAKAGIGVGVAVAFIAGMAITWLLFRSRQKKTAREFANIGHMTGPAELGPYPSAYPAPYKDQQGPPSAYHRAELDASHSREGVKAELGDTRHY